MQIAADLEKIKEEEFTDAKHKLLSFIANICNNLPCPECAQHARSKIGTLNANNIKTKRDLQLMLLSFHNFVNQRTGKPQFTEEQLDEKYKKELAAIKKHAGDGVDPTFGRCEKCTGKN